MHSTGALEFNLVKSEESWNFQESFLDAHLTTWYKVPQNSTGREIFYPIWPSSPPVVYCCCLKCCNFFGVYVHVIKVKEHNGMFKSNITDKVQQKWAPRYTHHHRHHHPNHHRMSAVKKAKRQKIIISITQLLIAIDLQYLPLNISLEVMSLIKLATDI